MIKSPLCKLVGIEYPIFQGGMAWVANAELASAVSNAGGLGIIAAMNYGYDELSKEIEKAQKLTNKPFGVNVMLMSPFAKEAVQACIDKKVHVVTTGAGNPAPYVKSMIDAGIKVFPVVPSVAVAKICERAGVTGVITEGTEAGGHIGEITTMSLVPQIVDAVNIPVIAAGGIADGRQAAAAFMLGAVGVQVGTRFLVANECTIHQNYKDLVVSAKDIGTIATGRRLGHPVRSLKTAFSRDFYKLEYSESVTNEELEQKGSGALRIASVDGDLEKGCFMAGQVAAMVKKEESAKEIIEDIFTLCENTLKKGDLWIK